MKRRRYLAALGSLGALGALAGCEMPGETETETETQTPTETPERTTARRGTPTSGEPSTPTETPAEGAEDVVDIVDAGADATGSKPIDRVLDDVAADGVTVYFPPGRYRLGRFEGLYQGLTLVGFGATILPTQRESLTNLLVVEGRDNVVDGFLFDYRGIKMPPTISIQGPDGWVFRNCVFVGVQQTNLPEQTSYCLYPKVTSRSGTGRIERIYMHQGSAPPNEGDNRGGIWFGPNNDGEIRMDSLWMEHWAENTIYCHNSPGRVVIENSFFRNTNTAGTRIGGGTVLRNNTYVKTGPIPAQRWSGSRLMRGVWCSGGKTKFGQHGRLLVEDCDFVFTGSASVGEAIDVEYPPDEVVVRNCRITQDVNIPLAIQLGTTLTLDGFYVTGDTTQRAVDVADGLQVAGATGRVEIRGPVSNNATIRKRLQTGATDRADPAPPMVDPLTFLTLRGCQQHTGIQRMACLRRS